MSKQRKARDVRKAARDVIGEPSRNRKRGPHAPKKKPDVCPECGLPRCRIIAGAHTYQPIEQGQETENEHPNTEE